MIEAVTCARQTQTQTQAQAQTHTHERTVQVKCRIPSVRACCIVRAQILHSFVQIREYFDLYKQLLSKKKIEYFDYGRTIIDQTTFPGQSEQIEAVKGETGRYEENQQA